MYDEKPMPDRRPQPVTFNPWAEVGLAVLIATVLTAVILAVLIGRRESRGVVSPGTRMMNATDQLNRSIGVSGRYLAIEVRRISVPPPADPSVRQSRMNGLQD